jgi:hypothetical protein
MAGLVVLPLYGWLRRQFDQRVALAGCFLYAVHSELIRWSPEVMRDQTFWFLFVLSLYLLWRAVTEVRLWLFIAAGLTIPLAAAVRFEGLLLVVPLGLWSCWRWRALGQSRTRLAVGALCCAGAGPALAALVWLAWLPGCSAADWFRARPLVLARGWMEWMVAPLSGNHGGLSPVLPRSLGPISPGRMLEIYLPTVLKGLTPLYVVLLGVGIAGSRRLWRRRDHAALALAGGILLLAMWVHLWAGHSSCKRYAFPLVLMSCGFAALGLLRLSAAVAKLVRSPSGIALAPAVLLGGISLAVAFSSDCGARAERVRLGHWLRNELPAPCVLFGPDGFTQVVNYYAQGSCTSFSPAADAESVAELTERCRPDAVLLPQDQANFRRDGPLVRGLEAAGFQPVAAGLAPMGCGRVLVLSQEGRRKDEGGRQASLPPPAWMPRMHNGL